MNSSLRHWTFLVGYWIFRCPVRPFRPSPVHQRVAFLSPLAIDEAVHFHQRIRTAGLPFGAVIVNRMHEVPPEATTEGLEDLVGETLARRVESNLNDYRRLAERDRANVEALRRRVGRKPMIEVPELDEEVHDLGGLARVNEYLFAAER